VRAYTDTTSAWRVQNTKIDYHGSARSILYVQKFVGTVFTRRRQTSPYAPPKMHLLLIASSHLSFRNPVGPVFHHPARTCVIIRRAFFRFEKVENIRRSFKTPTAPDEVTRIGPWFFITPEP